MDWTQGFLKAIPGYKYDTIKDFDGLRVALRQIENYVPQEYTSTSKPHISKAATGQSKFDEIKGMIQRGTRMDSFESKRPQQHSYRPTQQPHQSWKPTPQHSWKPTQPQKDIWNQKHNHGHRNHNNNHGHNTKPNHGHLNHKNSQGNRHSNHGKHDKNHNGNNEAGEKEITTTDNRTTLLVRT